METYCGLMTLQSGICLQLGGITSCGKCLWFFNIKALQSMENGCGLIALQSKENVCSLMALQSMENVCCLMALQSMENGCGLMALQSMENGCGLWHYSLWKMFVVY